MNRRSTFQIAAVVGIVAIACVLFKVVPRKELPAIVPEKPPPLPPTSALFQADLLADWSPPLGVGSAGQVLASNSQGRMLQGAAAFLAVSAWAAQPSLPLPLGPCVELKARDAAKNSRMIDEATLFRWMFLGQSNWDALAPSGAVGSATGPAGPLAAVVSLVSASQVRAAVVERSKAGGVIEWTSRTTNTSPDGGRWRKTYHDKFLGRADEADRALRAFRERLHEKARQLGAELSDPTETVSANTLLGFAFNYTLAPVRGRVEAAVEAGLSADYELRLEVTETPE